MNRKQLVLLVAFSVLALSVFVVPYLTRRVTAWVDPRVAMRTYGFYLEESARALGIDFVHERAELDPRIEHLGPFLLFAGASVSITDINNSGWPDIYVTNSAFGSKNRLYVNRKGQGFEEVAERVGLADVNRAGTGVSTSGVWGDYDNSGYESLLLLKFGYLELFHNNGNGTFTRVTDQAGLANQWIYALDAIWWDFDRDGCLDIYVAGYFRPEHNLWRLDTTRVMWDSATTARNGGRNKLFHQIRRDRRCTGTFEEVSAQYRLDDPGWTISVGAADLYGSGFPDLYVANDFGPDRLFRNMGGTRFQDEWGFRDSRKGMNVTFGDFRNNGRLSIYVTNITKKGYLVEGNMLWENLGHGEFRDVAWDVGAADGGWGWGAQFGDLNNAGHQDIVAANGMISADPKQEYWYDLASVSRGSSFILEDAASFPPLGRKSLSGYERARVFLNDGTGRFRDVAEAVGVRDTFDKRGVVLVDLFHKGALDVVVATQRGPLLVYVNHVDPARKWIQFRLRGARSNRSALGAQVLLFWDDQQQVQEVHGAGFAGHGEKVLHFGLGVNPTLHRAEIRWPSGVRQVVRDLEANRRYDVTEPSE